MKEMVARPGRWLLLNVLFDETKFAVKLQAEGVASSSVLWSHAFLRSGEGLEVKEMQELVMPPVAVKSVTADGLLSGLRASYVGGFS